MVIYLCRTFFNIYFILFGKDNYIQFIYYLWTNISSSSQYILVGDIDRTQNMKYLWARASLCAGGQVRWIWFFLSFSSVMWTLYEYGSTEKRKILNFNRFLFYISIIYFYLYKQIFTGFSHELRPDEHCISNQNNIVKK